jgi:multidrug efflux system membrane fusion protein
VDLRYAYGLAQLEKAALHLNHRLTLAGGLLSLGLVCVAGCSHPAAGNSKPGGAAAVPVPVHIAAAKIQTVPVEISNIATVEAYRTVTVQSQVNGQITAVLVQPGEEVKKGQILFRIDPRLYAAALLQAQATLAKDQATAQNDLVSEKQEASLVKMHVASPAEYLLAKYTYQAAAAQVQADQAAVKTAQVNLAYCTISAPMDGRAGNLLAYPGSNVSATSTNLLVINELRPIYVAIALPQRYLVEVKTAWKDNPKLPMIATISGLAGVTISGHLSFIDNQVSAMNGTVTLMGKFANPTESLWPGELVNATLQIGELKNAVVVPANAVQVGQNGRYVYVIIPGHAVRMVPVVAGATWQGNTVITSGLKSGQVVVTDGQVRLQPGSRIQIVKTGLVAPSAAAARGT